MALIKCPECEHMISEYADKCVYCGVPMSKIKELLGGGTKKTSISTSAKKEGGVFNANQRQLVEELCDYILSNTNLIKRDQGRYFGFRTKGSTKLVIVFRIGWNEVYISFKGNIIAKDKTIEVSSETMETIKSIITINYSKEPTGTTLYKSVVPSSITFLSTRNEADKKIIHNFVSRLKKRIENMIVTDSFCIYCCQIPNGTQKTMLCWFSSGNNNDLEFKYYSNPLKKLDQKTIRLSENSIPFWADCVFEIYEKYFVLKNRSKTKSALPAPRTNATPLIYTAIINAIKGKAISGNKDIVETAKNVADFVMNEVKNKAIEDKFFKNEAEFNRFKYSFRFEPMFFGYSFSFKNLSIDDTKVFYDFYRAVKIIDVIKRYETIYNKTIINNYQQVLKSLKDIVAGGHDDYFMAKGLTSNFSLIPDDVLDETAQRLNDLLKLC